MKPFVFVCLCFPHMGLCLELRKLGVVLAQPQEFWTIGFYHLQTSHKRDFFGNLCRGSSAQVLESLQKSSAAPPAPFPLSEQYVANVLNGRAKGVGSKDAGKSGHPNPNPPSDASVNEAEPSEGVIEPKEWVYGGKRKAFIDQKRFAGFDYVQCVHLWDESHEKAEILGVVSVPELKRRKFLKAGATDNPWSEKLRKFREG